MNPKEMAEVRKHYVRLVEHLQVPPDRKVSLARDHDPGWTADLLDKRTAQEHLEIGRGLLRDLQDRLYAQKTYSLLIVLQAMDAAGKDGTIKHVMSGVNPQGCQVFAFKAPSTEELHHDFLWRFAKSLPERGRIGLFNRSYYEDVLVTRVHPELMQRQNLPPEALDGDVWKRRFRAINAWERHLVENGTVILKFFLNVSKAEQRRRFLERLDQGEKNWKFSANDLKERAFWKDYQRAYEDVFSNTSTPWAPWHVVPADHKWMSRIAVAATIIIRLQDLGLAYPKVSKEQKAALAVAKKALERE